MTAFPLGAESLRLVRRMALGTVAASVLGALGGAWTMARSRAQLADLSLQVTGRKTRLAEDRQSVGKPPVGPKPAALDRSLAVSAIRAALAARKDVVVDEFQASTDEAPYLTLYASDNKDPGWMQVPVRVLLRGRATALVAALKSLREIEVPFEFDTVEFTRQSTDHKGVATVTAQIAMRALVYRGEE